MSIDHPTPNQLPQLRQLWKQAFGDDDAFLDAFFSVGFSWDRCRCITETDTVAAALYWFDAFSGDTPFAYLYAVATSEAFRGRGLCHRLMEDTHRHLAASGYAATVLVPGSKDLFALYADMGYTAFGSIRKFTCTAGSSNVPLRRITPEEYAVLRRKLLPAGGILQEGATLAFLHTQAEFYAGENTLLAVTQSKDTLTVPELLGDSSLAPAIVCAFGASTGHFRTPGAGGPFAMLRSLTGEAFSPTYFGLALD